MFPFDDVIITFHITGRWAIGYPKTVSNPPLMCPLFLAWTSWLSNSRVANDSRRHDAHVTPLHMLRKRKRVRFIISWLCHDQHNMEMNLFQFVSFFIDMQYTLWGILPDGHYRNYYLILYHSVQVTANQLTIDCVRKHQPVSITRISCIGNPILEIGRSQDRVISTVGLSMRVRCHLYIE